jgi:hypothetical protein
MSARNVELIDASQQVIARGRVTAEGERCMGELDLGPMPDSIRHTFQEYEEIINGQVFSLLDEIEERIHALGIKAIFEQKNEATRIEDLQLYPSTGLVSFHILPLTAPPSSVAAS